MSGEGRIAEAGRVAFHVSLCAYVTAKGGDVLDLQRMWERIRREKPGDDLRDVWLDLDAAWRAVQEERER